MIAASSGGSSFFLIIIVLFAALWLIVVRPQRKRQNAQRQQLSQLQVGDEVLTAGGVYGRVTGLAEDEVRVEIAKQVEVRVARRAIAAILTEHEPVEPQEPGEAGEDDGGEKWQSAFDEAPGGGDSSEEKPG